VGLLYVSGKLPTYPSLKPIFCRNQCSEKYTVSVNAGLGEGYVGSHFPETYNDPKNAFLGPVARSMVSVNQRLIP